MAARQTVINKYNYLISELNKFKQMKDPATNLLNVAKHVQGHYDPAMASLLQQRATGGYGQLPNYSGLALPRQHPSAPFGARDQYSALQQQLGASQMQSPMLGSQSSSRLPFPNNPTSNLGLQLSDILPLEGEKQLELQQLLEAQQKYGMFGGDRSDLTKQELGDQSKHLASLGLQTMYGGAQRQALPKTEILLLLPSLCGHTIAACFEKGDCCFCIFLAISVLLGMHLFSLFFLLFQFFV
eukprot:TRINITY_DN38194_c0_g1_i12.p4 TRINITY_DN38194_c0_g1~~TRINITY_DN38194_c0_g1_i12.p4  ORF type:complete len:241 (-),score=12.24 TRINITY_DN38194_c0_g1_i12:693-1415(-)